MTDPQLRILLAGDPEPWDVAEGGQIVYRHPDAVYPQGRILSCDWILERTRDGKREVRRAAHDEVTITPWEEDDG